MEHKKEDVQFFLRVWLYARTGSGHCVVGEYQSDELREWAACNGGTASQAKAANAPGQFLLAVRFVSMVRAVRRGNVDAVAVTRLS